MYDRRGRLLVENVPTFVLRIMPADLPFPDRPDVASRLSDLTGISARARSSNDSIGIPDRSSNWCGSPTSIPLPHESSPRIRTCSRRARRCRGPTQLPARQADLACPWLDRTHLWPGVPAPSGRGLLARGPDRQDRARVHVRRRPAGHSTASRRSISTPRATRSTPRELLREPVPGNSLELTIDTRTQKDAERALKWAMSLVGIDRGVVMAMNPQNGEILAMVSLPAYDNNAFAQGISTADFKKLLKDPARPMLNQAIAEQSPPGSTYKLITGSGALQDGKIKAGTRIRTEPFIEIGDWKYWDWNKEGFGVGQHLRWLRPLERHVLLQAGGHARHRPPGLLGAPVGLRQAHRHRSARRGRRASCRRTTGSAACSARSTYTGEVYQAGIGQGFNASHAHPDAQRLRRPGQRRHALQAAAGAARPRLPTATSSRRSSRRSSASSTSTRACCAPCASPRAVWSPCGTPTTWSICPSSWPASPVPRSSASATSRVGCRSATGSSRSCPRSRARPRPTPRASQAVRREDSELVILAYAHDTRTAGNAATEIVKYFLQLHYGLKVDLRDRSILQRANFYGG